MQNEKCTFYNFNPCPAVPKFILFENTVDPDQMASDEAIWSGSTLFSTLACKYMLITGMLQVNRMQLEEECSQWFFCLSILHLLLIMRSFYFSESQDAMVLQTCHERYVHKFAVGPIDMGNSESQDSKAQNCKWTTGSTWKYLAWQGLSRISPLVWVAITFNLCYQSKTHLLTEALPIELHSCDSDICLLWLSN